MMNTNNKKQTLALALVAVILVAAGTPPALAVLRGHTDSSAADRGLGSSSPTANLELALGFVYKLYHGSAWNILARASDNWSTNSLNIAMPDFSVEYWVTAFEKDTTATLTGSFPEWARYAALTAYGTDGMPFASVNMVDQGADRTFTTTFTSTESDFVVLARVYRSKSHPDGLTDAEKFAVSVDGQAWKIASETKARVNGKILEWPIQYAVGNALTKQMTSERDMQMFRPAEASLPGVFPNEDARYMITYPTLEGGKCAVFHGRVPAAASGREFYGFMAVEMKSTATVASLSDEDLGGWGSAYTVFACRDEADARGAGYDAADASHHLLLAGDVKVPGVILRDLNTAAGQGLKATDKWAAKGQVTPEQCQSVLGKAYPVMNVR
ncbi:MAG: hypothetical protein HRU01_22950 [Myxococcales bacterium]|nr:hypothetical protein [Myxococcales bacterium]